MSIRGIMKKLGGIFLPKEEYIYRPKGGGPPIYIIGDGVYKIKPEDMYRSLTKENVEGLKKAFLKSWGLLEEEPADAEEKESAEVTEAPETAPKNSLKRPEGAD